MHRGENRHVSIHSRPIRRLTEAADGQGSCGLPLPEGRGSGKGFHLFRRLVDSSFHPALLQNSVEKHLDRRRRERSEPGATSPRRMVMRHGGGRGAEAMFRGAEPLCGCAAQGRKRAGRGYMLPLARVEHGLTLWQRMLPLKPEQSRTPRTTPSTRFCNRAFPPEGEVSKHKGIFDERIPFRRNVRARSFAEHE